MKRPFTTTVIAAALAAALPGTADAVRIDYSLDAGYERDDNVALSATDPIEQDILRLGAGFALTHDTSTVQASLAGRVDHRRYEDIYDDATDRMLEGRLNWMIVPDRFGFVLEDRYGVQTINRFAPASPDNRQQVNVLSLGPNFYFNAGGALRGQAELRYIDSHAEVTQDFNSSRVAGALRIIKDLDATSSLSFNLQGQDIDFDNDLFARDHKRYEAFATYRRQFNRFDMQLDGGWSRLDYADGQSRNNPLARAEIGWQPSERSRFNLNAANQFSDAATSALDQIGATTGIPASVMTGDSTVTASAYEVRELGGGYEYTGVRTSLSLSAYHQRLDYIDVGTANEEARGGSIGFGYRLQPTLTLRASASANRTEYNAPANRREDNRLYSLGLEKQWSRHWSSTLSATRYSRSSSLDSAEFEQNLIYIGVTYRNR
ncbi:hypothetical protein E2F46_01010 [Luteimonas aestuarii]|uniref:Outer membrane beta-barrel protein n=1 Tax=Luteimonas aestuarii TaxID=453837 RepID=A0A4R5U432_9GAMM|nr:hypothetical protein [Luteimonas aestuarii]TDK28500.1 hypothetical protein E2F46_01010 [Luteimonas aestuarii]